MIFRSIETFTGRKFKWFTFSYLLSNLVAERWMKIYFSDKIVHFAWQRKAFSQWKSADSSQLLWKNFTDVVFETRFSLHYELLWSKLPRKNTSPSLWEEWSPETYQTIQLGETIEATKPILIILMVCPCSICQQNPSTHTLRECRGLMLRIFNCNYCTAAHSTAALKGQNPEIYTLLNNRYTLI